MNKQAGADKNVEWAALQAQLRQAQGLKPDPSMLLERFHAALERLRKATPRPAVFAQAPGLITAADGLLDFDPTYNKPMILPPRITPRLTRREAHAIIADPNIGKTTLTFLLAFAIAYERPELLGLLKIDWCGPALIVSNEDDPIDGALRWREPRRYFNLTDPPKHILTIWPDTLALGYVQDDTLIPTEAGCAFVERLAARAERDIRYAYMVFDPLAGMFPGITENAPLQMAAVVQQFFDPIAKAAFAAVDVCHHTKKSARDEEKVNSYRGGSGLEGALGEMSTLARLTPKEHMARGFPPEKLGRILRLMGQRKRRGPYAGTHYFERVVQNVPAVDARQPDQLAAEPGSVAFAAPIALPSKPGLTLDNVQGWLWKANQGDDKDRLTRGQRGRGKEGEAVKVVMEKSGCDRKAAEAAIDELEQLKRIVLRKATINGNKVEIVIAEVTGRSGWG